MQKARNELNRQNSPEAEKAQEEAQEQLEEAKQALEEELNQYVQEQQEQMLVQVEERLRFMKKKQLEVNEETLKLDLEVRQRGDWSSALKNRGRALYGDQDEVKKASDETVEALKTGNYGGFTKNMEIIQRLLLDIMGAIEGRDVGEGTQISQLEVIEKIDRMIGAVEGERKRLAEQRQGQQQQQQQPGQPGAQPLVSKLAEMELVYEEQKSLGNKIRRLTEMSEGMDRDELPDYYRRLFERYSTEQRDLKTIWDDLRKQIPGAPAE
jgi:hypothetical protein